MSSPGTFCESLLCNPTPIQQDLLTVLLPFLFKSWPDEEQQILRYIADRTGVLSYANLPIMWLFAGRNNIFHWATGWSFATFNVFHRHVARIATVQAIVHSIAYTILYFKYTSGESRLWAMHL